MSLNFSNGQETTMSSVRGLLLAVSVGFGVSVSMANATVIAPYFQTNLVSNVQGLAPVTDPNLQNPWGVSESATSPLWISDQAANVATLYTVNGLTAAPLSLVVPIPTMTSPPNGPTGQVNNNTSSFVITQTGTPTAAHFIFANLNGGIYAWAAAPNPAQLEVSTPGAVYTGLAIGGPASAPLLYAANGAGNGSVDVFDGAFHSVNLGPNAFKDPNLPGGYVPFNVQNINGNIYVAYAPATIGANRTPQTMAIAGQGYVDIYDASGTLLKRLISNSLLAAPWGMTVAPSGFGEFSGDLLVGNFSYIDGQINVFDPSNGDFIATLDSNPAWQGLWALTFGNGASGGSPDILYFTTGLRAETGGLFAAVAVPEPSGVAMLAAALGLLAIWRVRRAA
jgi:uncharacterized protein (TIGR03118 family)